MIEIIVLTEHPTIPEAFVPYFPGFSSLPPLENLHGNYLQQRETVRQWLQKHARDYSKIIDFAVMTSADEVVVPWANETVGKKYADQLSGL